MCKCNHISENAVNVSAGKYARRFVRVSSNDIASMWHFLGLYSAFSIHHFAFVPLNKIMQFLTPKHDAIFNIRELTQLRRRRPDDS